MSTGLFFINFDLGLHPGRPPPFWVHACNRLERAGMLRRVAWIIVTNVCKDHSAFIFQRQPAASFTKCDIISTLVALIMIGNCFY